ncbi:hypothetical protein QUB49_36770, partial [Microcoleus sp. AT9_B4]
PHSADIQAEGKEDRFGNTKLPNDCRAIVWEFLVYNIFLLSSNSKNHEPAIIGDKYRKFRPCRE